jgi:hypothetical protein
MHISTYIFPARVADSFMGGAMRVRTKIEAPFISVQTVFLGDVVRDDLGDRHVICMSHIECAHVPGMAARCHDDDDVCWTRFAALHARNDWVYLSLNCASLGNHARLLYDSVRIADRVEVALHCQPIKRAQRQVDKDADAV